VTKSQADKAAEYVNYARHCLKTAETLPDRESRILHREMAAEWLRLAGDSARHDAALNAANDYVSSAASL
jgi:hypothetical protein